MNFYDLKSKLNFPYLAGAIRLKSDCLALMQLNEERAGRLWDLALLVELNQDEVSRPYEGQVCEALMSLWAMHKKDVETIKKYLVQHKMLE
jgi:hypothetical protein